MEENEIEAIRFGGFVSGGQGRDLSPALRLRQDRVLRSRVEAQNPARPSHSSGRIAQAPRAGIGDFALKRFSSLLPSRPKSCAFSPHSRNCRTEREISANAPGRFGPSAESASFDEEAAPEGNPIFRLISQ